MTLFHSLSACPSGHGAVVVMSGGMDSTIAARLAVEKYGAENVHALSFYYGQKQSIELTKAQENSVTLKLAKHQLVDISFLGDMVRGVCANIVGGLVMPTIKDVLGDPAPPSEVPYRNAILFMVAASYAQANKLGAIITGIQAADQYGYWDTTPAFVQAMNDVIKQNRVHNIKVHAPWQGINKAAEIAMLIEMDGHADLLKNTITCYDPTGDVSCGVCPSCAERIANFAKAGLVDSIPYAIDIPWHKMIK